jgi:RNA polymerase sigma-70 factor (ECF subfamily)
MRAQAGGVIPGVAQEERLALSSRSRRDADFESFYRQHWPRLVAALTLVLPESEDPEDAAQEAFARAYQHWSTISSYDAPDGWLFVTGYRVAIGVRRRAAVRARKGWLAAQPRGDESTDMTALALGTLSILTSRQRAAVLLRHYYGYSTREVARALKCREGTVKSLVARGKDALKAAERRGDDD